MPTAPYTIIPTIEAINLAKTWKQAYVLFGLTGNNTRAQERIKKYVKEHFPHCPALQPRRGIVTDERFAEIVASSISVNSVIQQVGWKLGGGTYTMVYDRINRQGLDSSHFRGQGYLAGQTHDFSTKPIVEYLTKNGRRISSNDLKKRLIKDGIKSHKCEWCETTEWRDQPVPIQLDHINGDKYDNRLENLRILCPNCHAQTDTYAGKNTRSARVRRETLAVDQQSKLHKQKPQKLQKPFVGKCVSCDEPRRHGKYCSQKCSHKAQEKIDWDSIDLISELKTKSKLTIANELGCSDNAVRKRLRKIGAGLENRTP